MHQDWQSFVKQLKHWYIMNTVNGSFKSDLKVSLPSHLTIMVMHRNAKMRLAIGKNIPK